MMKNKLEIWLPAIIALATFLWYRRGRLWKFYYSLLDTTIKKFGESKLDMEGWEKIAEQNANSLVSDYFGVLFQFELEYLRFVIIENKRTFWKADSSSSSHPDVSKEHVLAQYISTEKITDGKAFCESKMGRIFYWRFFFCGAGLFFQSIFWVVFRKKRDKGVLRTEEVRPIRGISKYFSPPQLPDNPHND